MVTSDRFYMNICHCAEENSPGESGCVVVAEDGQIIIGADSGFLAGGEVHKIKASDDAIMGAAKCGIPLLGAKMYLHDFIPPAECALRIVEVGIRELVVLKIESNEGSADSSMAIFEKAGTMVRPANI